MWARNLSAIGAAAALALSASASAISMIEPAPISLSGGRGPIHRRGKFKPNARRQKGRKTLPRRTA